MIKIIIKKIKEKLKEYYDNKRFITLTNKLFINDNPNLKRMIDDTNKMWKNRK